MASTEKRRRLNGGRANEAEPPPDRKWFLEAKESGDFADVSRNKPPKDTFNFQSFQMTWMYTKGPEESVTGFRWESERTSI